MRAPQGNVHRALSTLQQRTHLPTPVVGATVSSPCLHGRVLVLPSDWLTPNAWAGGPALAIAPPLVIWALTLQRAIRAPIATDDTAEATAARAMGCEIGQTGGLQQDRLQQALANIDPNDVHHSVAAAQEGIMACARSH
jgi:hypothetical protein